LKIKGDRFLGVKKTLNSDKSHQWSIQKPSVSIDNQNPNFQ